MFHICGCRYSSSSKNTVQATVGYSTRRIYMVVQFQNLIVTRAGSGLLYFFKHLHPAIYADVNSVIQDHITELKLTVSLTSSTQEKDAVKIFLILYLAILINFSQDYIPVSRRPPGARHLYRAVDTYLRVRTWIRGMDQRGSSHFTLPRSNSESYYCSWVRFA